MDQCEFATPFFRNFTLLLLYTFYGGFSKPSFCIREGMGFTLGFGSFLVEVIWHGMISEVKQRQKGCEKNS